jgi:peroxiredoxin
MAAVGTKAPEFSLKSHDGRTVTSAEFRGSKWLVVSAYPLAFTGG